MIPILKQRLSKYYFFFVVSLLFPLIGFFVYAARKDMRFFVFLAVAFFINIILLFFLYRRLKDKQYQVKLQKEEFFEKTNLLKDELEHEWQVIGAFRQKIVAYSQLKVLIERLSASLSTEETVQTLCREVARLFEHGDSTVAIYLFDGYAGELAIALAERHQRPVSIKSKQGDTFDHWVVKTLQPLYLSDTKTDFRFDMDKIKDEDPRAVRSLLSVPLVVHNKPVGILRMDSPVPGRFSKEDLRFLQTIGDLAAVAVENAQLFDKVEDMAIRDGLTGLYLRRYLVERLAVEIDRSSRQGKELSLIMIDLDHFKKYNDQFGHTAGDIVLKTVGTLLCEHFSAPGNLLCRYGGEEFCVVLPECSKKEAQELAQEFLVVIAREEVVLRREVTRITASAGVASFPVDARVYEELIRKADAALYQAKEKGRNRVCAAGL